MSDGAGKYKCVLLLLLLLGSPKVAYLNGKHYHMWSLIYVKSRIALTKDVFNQRKKLLTKGLSKKLKKENGEDPNMAGCVVRM